MSSQKDKYWFWGDAKDIAVKLEKIRNGWLTYGMNPVYQAWVRNMIAYYSTLLKANTWDSALVMSGEQGELVEMNVPQARSLIRQIVGLVCKQRLAFTTTADSKGTDIVEAGRMGVALAAQIVTDHELDAKADMLAESAAVYGAAWLHVPWRSDRGEAFVPDVVEGGEESGDADHRILYNGDLEFQVCTPFDIVYDYRVEDWANQPWCEVRTIKNRWDLIAQFPEMEKELINVPSLRKQTPLWSYQQEQCDENDSIYVFTAYHKPTPALPKGRMVVYANSDCILYDDINPYGKIPVECCMPERMHGVCLGYPIFTNLLPLQEMMDHSFSAIATNQSAHAIQNITAPRGSGISVEDIGGMNFISFTPQNVPGGGKPEALQLTKSSPETFQFIPLILGHMQQMSNMNSAVRGEPPAGVKAGVAIATLTANALEFLNPFQKAWSVCIERAMKLAVENYKTFGHLPHTLKMQDRNGMSFTKEFTNKDISPIKGVKFTISNPMMSTIAGRSEIAEKLLPTGLIKNAQQYFSILDGAPVSQLYESELSENDLVHDENETLMEGGAVKALSIDDHAAHIRDHGSLLNKSSVRMENSKVEAILAHLMEHVQLSQTTDPMLTAMVRTGKMPQQPMAPMGGAPQGAGEPMQNKPAQAAKPAEKDGLGRPI